MSVARRARTIPARALLVALLAATAAPLAADAGGCPSRVTTTADGWRRVAAPAFGAGDDRITRYAVAPHQPDTMYVTNGTVVQRTTDGGCHWSESYSVPADALTSLTGSPVTASVGDVVAARQRVYLLLRGLAQPSVAVSDDAGRTWRTVELTGAVEPDVTYAVESITADTSGRHAYVVVRPTAGLGNGDLVYATHDSGATWTPHTVGVDSQSIALMSVLDIAADPVAGEDVWLSTTGGLYRSVDGGRTWRVVSIDPDTERQVGSTRALAVTSRAGRGTQVFAGSDYEPVALLRGAGGSWTTVNTPGQVESAAGGRGPDLAVLATATGDVYELDPATTRWRPLHRGAPALSRLSTDFTGTPRVHACVCGVPDGSVWSHGLRAPGTGRIDERSPEAPPPDGFPGYYGCAPDPRAKAEPAAYPSSAVSGRDVEIAPGKAATVPHRFFARPRELDVFFLLDTGVRSAHFGCAAKQGVVWAADELARTRNLRVGVGQYREFDRTSNPLGFADMACPPSPNDFVYHRDLRVGPVDKSFRQAMNRIEGASCNGDFAGATALFQAATGAGLDVAPTGASPGDITEGKGAGFAPDALKVVVHVAGGWFNTPQRVPGYPGVSTAAAVEALRAQGIRQVGIHVPDEKKKHHTELPAFEYSNAEALADLQQVARQTGAVARRPVECGSRRLRAVVQPGEPLVCTYTASAQRGREEPPIGSQVLGMVGSFEDPRRMRLTVLSGDAEITRRSPLERRRLDHLLPQTLDYAVTYRCGPNDAGEVKRVELGGIVGHEVVARTTTTVRCQSPVDSKPAAGAPEVDVPVAVPPAVGAAVAQSVPQLQPQPQAQTQAQGQGQAQAEAQGGLLGVAVPQEQAQARLAYADAGPPQEDGEYAISAVDRDGTVPWWAVSAAAALTLAAGGAMARQQAALRPAYATRRRRRG